MSFSVWTREYETMEGNLKMMNHLKLFIFCIFTVVSTEAFSQDLMSERIRKVVGKKRAVYFKKGIFYSTTSKIESTLKAVRHSFVSARGYERIVFDFNAAKAPKIYGYFSDDMKKIYIDFFDAKLGSSIGSFGDSKFVDKIDFYPVGDDSLSTEIRLKNKSSIDVFYLEKPGRLVIDIKG